MQFIPKVQMALCVISLATIAPLTAMATPQTVAKPGETKKETQPKTTAQPTVKLKDVQRVIYPVRFGNAQNLATVLNKFFKNGEVGQILAEPNSNSLLISVSKGSLKTVLDFIQELDRSPEMVNIDLWMIEVRKGKEGQDQDGLEKTFSGTSDGVNKKIARLQKQGLVVNYMHYQMGTRDNYPVESNQATSRPMIAGTSTTRGGRFGGRGGANPPIGGATVSNMITYRDTGTKVWVKPRVLANGDFEIQLKLDDSRLVYPKGGVQLGTEENGKPIIAAETVVSSLATQLKLTPNRAVVAEGVQSRGGSGETRIMVIVAAGQQKKK